MHTDGMLMHSQICLSAQLNRVRFSEYYCRLFEKSCSTFIESVLIKTQNRSWFHIRNITFSPAMHEVHI